MVKFSVCDHLQLQVVNFGFLMEWNPCEWIDGLKHELNIMEEIYTNVPS